MEVMPFQRSHGEQVRALIIGIQREEFGVPITLDEQPDLFDIPHVYQRGVGEFWVAVEGEQVVGTIALFQLEGDPLPPRVAALRKMFVAAGFRGPPHRTGQRLLDTLLAHAKGMGLDEVMLGTTGVMHGAHRFYEKNGFVEMAKADLPPGWPHNSVDQRFYRRGLKSAPTR